MGDLQDWSPRESGAVLVESQIAAEQWRKAEESTEKVIDKVHPTVDSDGRRTVVIEFVQRLLRESLGCEVYPFGSVPLKTYLPDGDIDLTALAGLNYEEVLAKGVCSVLENEELKVGPEFVVKDVQLIRAEVKLVKCLVENIVVDISFNQLGGLSTLCFLEKVDRFIGKNHLFKRSIILIKAWCYYESRILGAHHSLISTYALETMVLYIFHLFHSSLDGPLAVLYKFLEYFSKFDWDNYCVSLNGPVRISLLPQIVADTPDNGGRDLLLSNDFLKECMEAFSFPMRGAEKDLRTFPSKHLNIVDPLKENNNLGRSVSKGNSFRIRSAFAFGVRKLGEILLQPEENIADEIYHFFGNTLDRHADGRRADVQDAVPMCGYDGPQIGVPFSGMESCKDEGSFLQTESPNSGGQCGLNREVSLQSKTSINKTSGFQRSSGRNVHQSHGRPAKVELSVMSSEIPTSTYGTAVSESRFTEDAKDLATSKTQSLKLSNDVPKALPSGKLGTIPGEKILYAPHLYFQSSMTNKDCSGELSGGSDRREPKISGSEPQPVDEQKVQEEALSLVALFEEDHSPFLQAMSSSSSTPNCLNLSDLSGNYDYHMECLHHGRQWYELAPNPDVRSMSMPFSPPFQSRSSWDGVQWSVPFRRDAFSQMNTTGVVPRGHFFPQNPSIITGMPFILDEIPKPRGTGTYFPNAKHYKDRPPTGRGRNQGPLRSPRNNGRVMTPSEMVFPENGPWEFTPYQSFNHVGRRSGSLDINLADPPGHKAYPNANASVHTPDIIQQSGSNWHPSMGGSQSESYKQPNTISGIGQSKSGTTSPPPYIQKESTIPSVNQERVAERSYYLKNDDDFPPLST